MKEDKKIIKIGVIDSGIDLNFIEEHKIQIVQAGNFQVNFAEKTIESEIYDSSELRYPDCKIADQNGHGTEVTSIIFDQLNEKFDISFFIAKILDENKESNIASFYSALQWMTEVAKPEYLNLSLGTSDKKYSDLIYSLTEKANNNGIKIFCAASGVKSYPAEFSTVTTVGDKGVVQSGEPGKKIDIQVDDREVKLYSKGRWIKKTMFSSYASPLALCRQIYNEHKSVP
ncbi:MAG: S8 family serine peptidase [Rhodothermaceae bacterium]